MPRGDRTGPAGLGPMTGRRAGYCAGYTVPGYANPIPGYGFVFRGRGFGGGFGWRHRFYATGMSFWAHPAYVASAAYVAPTPEQEVSALKHEADWLKEQLDAVNRRIEELEQKAQ